MKYQPATEYTRQNLIELCERGVVSQDQWRNRDSATAQRQLGEAYALLRAGCDFKVRRGSKGAVTDDQTVWLSVTVKDFATFDWGGPPEEDLYYLPTFQRLRDADGRDWY